MRPRPDAAARDEAREPPWKAELRGRLRRKVTFEFVDTPLSEALMFLQTLTRATIILDLAADNADDLEDTPITYTATGTPLAEVLTDIGRKAGLTHDLVDHVVFIGRPADVATMKRLSALRQGRASRRDMSNADRNVRQKLLRKVTFCSPGTPLSELLRFLEVLTEVPIGFAPSVTHLRDTAVCFPELHDVPMSIALVWMLQPVGLTYEIRNGEVYITTPERLGLDQDG
jgi:hypothetical protein